jgi:ACS family tartrate transporter-like MFS transporter
LLIVHLSQPGPNDETTRSPALERARRKTYRRLLPLLGLCYVVAYIDRANVAIAKLTMVQSLPAFNNAVIGFGAGLFFVGYFLLEIPGSLLVEKWSARKWICRIMLSWGVMAALTAAVKTPGQFYLVRFLLGLAEAGFFPGVIVYLTHWFPSRDRTRALSLFLIATPLAQIVSPKISNLLLKIGTTETINSAVVHHPALLGMHGWQWMYVFWGVPAIVLGFVVLYALPDRPRDARWLSEEERLALENELERDHAARAPKRRMTLPESIRHPEVLLLALAYFCSTTGTYGIEFFLPSILERWYSLKLDAITWLVILPPFLALFGQLFNGWHSDLTRERRWHAVIPISLGAIALGLAPLTHGHLDLTIACFILAFTGLKSYQPAFWSLPTLFLTETAAAASIGFINSIGNLGGFLGPYVVGTIEKWTGSFAGGICFIAAIMTVSAITIASLKLKAPEQ